MTTIRAVDRQELIFEYMAGRPHEPITIPDLARAVGRSPGRAFEKDLAGARRIADDQGVQITNGRWNAQAKASTLEFLPIGKERGRSLDPLITQGRHAATRTANVASRSRYVARNADDPVERYTGVVIEAAYTAAAQITAAALAEIDRIRAERVAQRRAERVAQRRAHRA